MAILTATQLAQLQNLSESERPPITHLKPQLNAAFQAVEDWFEANRASLSTALNTATTPLILTPSQKRALVKAWLLQKFERGG